MKKYITAVYSICASLLLGAGIGLHTVGSYLTSFKGQMNNPLNPGLCIYLKNIGETVRYWGISLILGLVMVSVILAILYFAVKKYRKGRMDV